MPNGPSLSLASNQKRTIHVKAIATDGTTEDTAAVLNPSSGHPEFCTATVDPSDPRAVILTGVAAGNTFIVVDEDPAVADSNNRLVLFVSVVASAAPDLRRVDFVSADAPVAK